MRPRTAPPQNSTDDERHRIRTKQAAGTVVVRSPPKNSDPCIGSVAFPVVGDKESDTDREHYPTYCTVMVAVASRRKSKASVSRLKEKLQQLNSHSLGTPTTTASKLLLEKLLLAVSTRDEDPERKGFGEGV